MEPGHVKEALSQLLAMQNKGDRSLRHATEGIINMVEGITICSRKEHHCFFLFQR